MPKVAVLNMEGTQVEEMDLNDVVFGATVNESLIHSAVLLNLASRRRGTHQSKTRSFVSGGGKKPWRQKGTGRARVGSSRNPIWTGGGVAFGPHPRSHSFKMPRKMRQAALRSALSDKVQNGQLIVLDDIVMETAKTKNFAEMLNKLNANNALVVIGEYNEVVIKSGRNIPKVLPLEATGVNVYNVMAYNKLIMTKSAVAKIEEVLS